MSRRPKGIVQTSDGSYAIDTSVRRDGMKVHVYKSGFSTVAEAKANMRIAIDEAFDRRLRSAFGYRKLRESFDSFLRDMDTKKARQTVYGIDRKVTRHFLSHFDMEGLTPKEITCSKVTAWYEWFGSQSEPSNDTKNKLLSDVRKFMEFLWRKEKSITSECYQDIMGVLDSFAKRKAPPKEKEIWDREQVERFISATPRESRDRVMMSLLFYLGARIGEFLAITWGAVDFGKNVIRIERQVIKNKGAFVTEELKTSASYRECWMDDWVRDMLLDYKGSLNAEDRQDGRFLFHAGTDSRSPMSFHNFSYIWKRYERKAGLPHTTPHGARHRKASELAALCRNEEEVKAASEFLGHSPSMMMEVYVHSKSTSMKNILSRSKLGAFYEK